MTTFRLLRALTRTMQKCEWQLLWGNAIRTNHPDSYICPITFVEGIATGRKARTSRYYHEAGKVLGFDDDLTKRIAKAADLNGEFDPQLRRILLKAARLK